MSLTTEHLGLVKPQLTDAPPDITAMNPNWDVIDEEINNLKSNGRLITYTALDQLGLTPGSETISSIMNAMADNSMLQMSTGSGYNTSQYPQSGYGTLVVFKKNSARNMLLYSYTNTTEFAFYYGSCYNDTFSGWSTYLPTNGGKVTGNLEFQKVNNGHAAIYKNHSATSDYGIVIRDETVDGKTANVSVCASENDVTFQDNDGTRHELYGEHNGELLKANIAHNMKLYGELSQIGLTDGSETIETIATRLPTYSRLTLTVGSASNLSIYPNSNYGLLTVEKTTNSRVVFNFTNNKGTQWHGVYVINSGGNTWTDWFLIYDSAYITSGTTDLVDGSTALTTGRLHVVY